MRPSGRPDSVRVLRSTLMTASLLVLFAAFGCGGEPAAQSSPPANPQPTPTTAPSPTPTPVNPLQPGPTPGEIKVPEMDSRRHLDSPDETHEPYNSTPATSGPHYPIWWQEWGVVDQELPDELLVHNLEHGGIVIRYDCPSGCPALIDRLAEVTGRYKKVILAPYSGLGTRIALTAWTYLDRFDEFDEDRIVRFIEAHMNSPEAPEPLVYP